ncbi:MAG: hypothetical protein UZ07_CHB004002603, partial [Chlorobi bacterium OLB7]
MLRDAGWQCHIFQHLHRHPGNSLRVVRALNRCAARRHVAVADCLDSLAAVLRGNGIEVGEDEVHELQHSTGWHLRGHWGEADDIGEEDAGGVEAVGDLAFAGDHPIGNAWRESFVEKLLGGFCTRTLGSRAFLHLRNLPLLFYLDGFLLGLLALDFLIE